MGIHLIGIKLPERIGKKRNFQAHGSRIEFLESRFSLNEKQAKIFPASVDIEVPPIAQMASH